MARDEPFDLLPGLADDAPADRPEEVDRDRTRDPVADESEEGDVDRRREDVARDADGDPWERVWRDPPRRVPDAPPFDVTARRPPRS